MPKKFSIALKREWLHAYEDGKSEASISRDNRCDVRTLKNGLDEARLERTATLAKAEAIKEAFHNHNQRLLSTIEDLLPALMPLPLNQPIPWRQNFKPEPLAIVCGKAQYEILPTPRVSSITLDAEAKVEWKYLIEHLRRDPLGQALKQWKKALADHIEARIALKRKLSELLKKETGYRMLDKPANQAAVIPENAPFLDPFLVDLLFQEIIKRLPEVPDTVAINDNIVAEPNSGEITYSHGQILAYTPEKAQELKEQITAVIDDLSSSGEIRTVINTYGTVKDLGERARQAADEILMLGLIPGQCQLCRRLGM